MGTRIHSRRRGALLAITIFCSTVPVHVVSAGAGHSFLRGSGDGAGEDVVNPSAGGDDAVCETSRNLDEFPQWREEVGYWLGALSFYGPDGEPFVSEGWNYPYDNYNGFITGNIAGGSYRQRNVFLYPPQKEDACRENDSTVGDGKCGANGNAKIFFADQSVAGKSCDGAIAGKSDGILDTKTTLVGEDNAVLYQIFYGDKLFQSQLTTMSGNGRRTRSAQGFDPFGASPSVPTSCSFYRERRVEKEEFYAALNATLDRYHVLDADACARDSVGRPIDGIVGGYDACVAHLEESFELGNDGTAQSDVGDGAGDDPDGVDAANVADAPDGADDAANVTHASDGGDGGDDPDAANATDAADVGSAARDTGEGDDGEEPLSSSNKASGGASFLVNFAASAHLLFVVVRWL